MPSIKRIKESFADNHVQFLLIDFKGFLVESCDSIFNTQELTNQPVRKWFPLIESILQSIPPQMSQELYYPKINNPFDKLPGIYDFYFSILKDSPNYILWRVYDYSKFYKTIHYYQQKLNEAMLNTDASQQVNF